jgi:hypothetical protein
VWFLIAGSAALFFAIWPRTALRWGVVLVFGPIALFAVEACGEALNTALGAFPVRARVSARTKQISFSGLRVLYLLFETVIILAVIIAAGWLIRSIFPDQVSLVVAFMRSNFYGI